MHVNAESSFWAEKDRPMSARPFVTIDDNEAAAYAAHYLRTVGTLTVAHARVPV
jgi:hypothetical protein